MDHPAKSLHGTCVASGQNSILLRGESGAGKSDLALRFLHLENPDKPDDKHSLVADDRVIVSCEAGKLIAKPPESIAGLIEVRGIGVVPCKHIPQAELKIIADLVSKEHVPRMQYPFDENCFVELEGQSIPCIKIFPFETSAPVKLKCWLQLASSETDHQPA